MFRTFHEFAILINVFQALLRPDTPFSSFQAPVVGGSGVSPLVQKRRSSCLCWSNAYFRHVRKSARSEMAGTTYDVTSGNPRNPEVRLATIQDLPHL